MWQNQTRDPFIIKAERASCCNNRWLLRFHRIIMLQLLFMRITTWLSPMCCSVRDHLAKKVWKLFWSIWMKLLYTRVSLQYLTQILFSRLRSMADLIQFMSWSDQGASNSSRRSAHTMRWLFTPLHFRSTLTLSWTRSIQRGSAQRGSSESTVPSMEGFSLKM